MKYIYNGKEITPNVGIYHDIYPYLGNVTEKEFYLDAEKCAKSWKIGNEKIMEVLGEHIKPRTPSCMPLSYGHLVSIGAHLNVPEDSEPNVIPFAHDIDEAVSVMKERRNIDFSDNDIFRHYIETNKYLQEVFPEFKISPLAGYGMEGVITTAELIRGQDLFCDIYDDPEKVHEFLSLVNESVINFSKFVRRFIGVPEIQTTGSVYLADDFASIIPPSMWDEFVIPYWNEYYEALGKGCNRFLHCENTYPEQLKYLKDAKITHYQPSVADRLTIENVKENTDIPFDWLLYAYHITEMTDEEIEAWVDKAVQAGITNIRTQFGKYAWSKGRMDRILAFYKAFEKYRVE
ncbi:MAG: hypothetical protein IKZ25_02815 [Clostridia bacterium]|nr:hypothetical protein [Clostridia bacterium]